MAGEFTFREKIKKAVKINLQFYALYLILGIVFLVYLLFKGEVGGIEGLKRTIITLVFISGVTQIVLCLGYSLVSIPKRFF
mmetsp:Transcript_1290/g.1175  ORF Transcript_1290/g.1175 Transcript_1290/m.1175 type:complete len:81 (+) Transcript_1290:380-622(+)